MAKKATKKQDHAQQKHSNEHVHGEHCNHDHEGHAHDHGHDMPRVSVKRKTPAAHGNAEEGNLVMIHYTGTLDDGEQFDSSRGREPIEFVLGEHTVIKGFEDAVSGMKKGDKKKISIDAKDAYGDVNPMLQQEVPREAFGELQPEEGMLLALNHPMAEQPIPVRVVKVSPEMVIIDLNHPLAGKRLHFDLELVDIK